MPDNEVVGFSFDPNGNVTAITPPGRPAHSFTYTPSNRLATYQLPDVGQGPSTETRTYDADLRLTSVLRPDGKTVSFQYDTQKYRLQRIVSPRGNTDFGYHPATGQLTSITEPDGQGLAFEYDGPLVTKTTWTGEVSGSVERTYDSDLRLSELRVNGEDPIQYVYDDDSRLIQVGEMTITRDLATGRELTTTLGNVTTERTYTEFGEPATYMAKFSGVEIYYESYTYNKNGWIVDLERRVHGASTLYHYVYDLRGRLTEVWENGSLTSSYTYDANSNRLSYTGPLGNATATYDARDRLLTYGNATYTYTEAGELASKTENGQTTLYDYDVFGNLRRVDLPNGIVVEYLTDGAQRRVGKKVGGSLVSTWNYQDSIRPISEERVNGDRSRFVYALRTNVPDVLLEEGATYRFLHDQVGSPRLAVDVQSGRIAQELRFDEFGRVLLDTNPGFQPFGFAGGLGDSATGLLRFGLRDFMPNLGRWSTPDPSRFVVGSVNLYSYSGENPVNYLDPYGSDAITQNQAIKDCAYKLFKKADYGQASHEEAAWIVDRQGRLWCQVWPSTRKKNKTTTSSRPPDAIGQMHTHPTSTEKGPILDDIPLGDRTGLPIYVLHRTGIRKYDPATKKTTLEESEGWGEAEDAEEAEKETKKKSCKADGDEKCG